MLQSHAASPPPTRAMSPPPEPSRVSSPSREGFVPTSRPTIFGSRSDLGGREGFWAGNKPSRGEPNAEFLVGRYLTPDRDTPVGRAVFPAGEGVTEQGLTGTLWQVQLPGSWCALSVVEVSPRVAAAGCHESGQPSTGSGGQCGRGRVSCVVVLGEWRKTAMAACSVYGHGRRPQWPRWLRPRFQAVVGCS
jgi:hypothetical protein